MNSSHVRYEEVHKSRKVMADHFSRDLLIDIFSRLGVKQLCQLKCLSKEWLHTISSPYFKKQHRDQSKKSPSLSLISSTRSFRSQFIHLSLIDSSNYVHEYEDIAFIGEGNFMCSSGLDLLCFYETCFEGGIWICNPITKKTLDLRHLSDFSGKACLGYVSSTNEYKIVVSFEKRVLDDFADWNLEADYEQLLSFKILTLKLEETSVVGSWRDLLSCTDYSETSHQPVHINGFIYWLAYATDNSFCSNPMTILEMNLENEEVKTLCWPNGCSFRYSHLAEINGHLCLVQCKTDDGNILNVWTLKNRESEGWCLEYSIEVHEKAYNFTILGYLPRNNGSTGDILFQTYEGKIFCYETDTQKFKELQSLNERKFECCAFYYESLFSISLPGD